MQQIIIIKKKKKKCTKFYKFFNFTKVIDKNHHHRKRSWTKLYFFFIVGFPMCQCVLFFFLLWKFSSNLNTHSVDVLFFQNRFVFVHFHAYSIILSSELVLVLICLCVRAKLCFKGPKFYKIVFGTHVFSPVNVLNVFIKKFIQLQSIWMWIFV